MSGRLESTGVQQQVTTEVVDRNYTRIMAEAIESKSHVWAFNVVHRLTEDRARRMAWASRKGRPLTDPLNLDAENLLLFGGPICFICETVEYTRDPCPGWARGEPA